jgi:hypothetical protein
MPQLSTRGRTHRHIKIPSPHLSERHLADKINNKQINAYSNGRMVYPFTKEEY